MMQILGLLGMYFDALVVFVTNSSLLFRLAMAILCKHLLFRWIQIRIVIWAIFWEIRTTVKNFLRLIHLYQVLHVEEERWPNSQHSIL